MKKRKPIVLSEIKPEEKRKYETSYHQSPGHHRQLGARL